MPPPSPSCSSSLWQLSYTKLRFFTRIRRFLNSKTNRKKLIKPSQASGAIDIIGTTSPEPKQVDYVVDAHEDSSVLLQRAVKKLHFGGPKEKEMAAMEIKRLAKEDFKVKKLMAELGVIPALVAMAASEVVGRRLAAVTALVELASGTYTNKALMVEAGILEKLPNNIDSVDEATRHGLSEFVLSLSSLKNTHVSLNPSQVLPFILAVLNSGSSQETKESCLGTLYNFSTVLENAANLASNDNMVDTLFRVVSTSKALSEKALAILGNIVVTFPGKKLVENSGSVPEGLIEALSWDDFPKSQELSAYVLMVLAHQSSAQRAKMAAAGIVPVLLEVALLGSALAQKRALKLLQWFKEERQTRVGPHSGPQARRIGMGSPVIDRRERQEGKRIMQRLVKESLKKNMDMITRRANYNADDDSSSKLKSLVISTSSKSLPY